MYQQDEQLATMRVDVLAWHLPNFFHLDCLLAHNIMDVYKLLQSPWCKKRGPTSSFSKVFSQLQNHMHTAIPMHRHILLCHMGLTERVHNYNDLFSCYCTSILSQTSLTKWEVKACPWSSKARKSKPDKQWKRKENTIFSFRRNAKQIDTFTSIINPYIYILAWLSHCGLLSFS